MHEIWVARPEVLRRAWVRRLRAFGKKGSGTVVRSTLWAVPATVPDPFFPNALTTPFGVPQSVPPIFYDSSISRSSRVRLRISAVVGVDDRVGQFALLLLQLQHLFLDGVAGDQAVGEDRLRLADAVRAVDGLRLDGRVPPRIEQEDILGGGEIQAQSARLQADQEQLALRDRSGSAPRAAWRSRVRPSRYS